MEITKVYYDVLPRKKQHLVTEKREKVKREDIEPPCVLFLDQASNTGYSLYDNRSRLVMSGTITKGNMELPKYKEMILKYIDELIKEYNIGTIFYEEVYDAANMITTEVLFYIKHAIQDIGYYNKNVEVLGLDHSLWKSKLAKPKKFDFDRDHKKEVKKWVQDIYPLIVLTQEDQTDALGMGIAIMIKEKGQKNFYKNARYNKRLPIHLGLHEKVNLRTEFNVEDTEGKSISDNLDSNNEEVKKIIEEYVSKMRIHFRRAYKVGGIHEMKLDRRRGVEDNIRRFLSHKDSLLYIRIPKDYKYWGIILLEHGKSPEEFETEDNPEGEYMLLACRKKRKRF